MWHYLRFEVGDWRAYLREARQFYSSWDMHETADLVRGLVPAFQDFAASMSRERILKWLRSFFPVKEERDGHVNEIRSFQIFRYGIVAASVILGVEAAWTLAAELMRPPRPAFPAAPLTASAGDHEHNEAAAEAGAAARFAGLRGDLWADDAMLLAAGRLTENNGARPRATPGELKTARAAAARAAQLAPHDSRIWLLIAAVDAAQYGRDRRVTAPLKMSYYTGLYDPALMPLRLRIATRSDAIVDDGLQLLVSADLRAIVRTRPDLRPAIAVAYRGATAQGRIFLEDAVYDLDPQLAASIQRVSSARAR